MAGVCESVENEFSLESEISQLKHTFNDECKIIENVGEYRYVVNIRPKKIDLNLKFQLTDAYPREAPVIFISSKTMHPQRHDHLLAHLRKVSANVDPQQPKLQKLYDSALAWIAENGVDLDIKENNSKRGPTKKKKGKKNSDSHSDDDSSEKKPSMKTAQDVIKRIQWDSNISADLFVVGYIDRFMGIQEKSFSAFSWEDIASVDYDTLAIPQHRIQYFKYQGVKVWDKNERLDNVFGSTGSGVTIADVVSKLPSGACAQTETRSGKNNKSDDHEDSEDDNDDMVVSIKLSEEDQDEPRGLSSKEKYWGEKLRPNYFLALRITDPHIISQVKHLQELMTDVNPEYEESVIPTEKLHVTLCCLGLDTDQQIGHCVRVLRDMEPELEDMKPRDIELEFEGTDNFFLNVIYAKVKENKPLHDFVDHIKTCITQEGVQIRDVFGFVPHMTLMKFTRQHQREHHTKFVDPRLFELGKDVEFGKQTLNNIHLCSMSSETSSDGFYVCPTTMLFQ